MFWWSYTVATVVVIVVVVAVENCTAVSAAVPTFEDASATFVAADDEIDSHTLVYHTTFG